MPQPRASSPGGLLAVWVDVPGDVVNDFTRWYDEEHLPERRNLPGFRNATRFGSVGVGGHHMALYELDDIAALDWPGYRAVKAKPDTELGRRVRAGWQRHERIVYRHFSSLAREGQSVLASPYVLSVRAHVRPDYIEQFQVWLQEEHAPRLVNVAGVLAYRGFLPVDGDPHVLNLWGLADPSVFTSAGWERARHTPWRDRLAPGRGPAVRQVYRRVDEH